MLFKYNEPNNEITLPKDTPLRLITILDPHFSPYPPASRKDDFLAATEESFRQAVRFAIKVQAQGLLIAGDVFHLKNATRNPTWFQNRMIRLFREPQDAGLLVLGIAGNHDVTFGSKASLDKQPLGILIEADAYHLLDDKSVVFHGNQFGSCRVAGCSFEHSKAAPTRDLRKNGANYLVGTGHFWFGDKTGDFFGEPMYGMDYLDQSEVDVYVIGHHHEDQGIRKFKDKWYFSHGSMNRIGSHANDLIRRPSVGLLEIGSGISGKVGYLKQPPADQIFDLVVRKQVVEEQKELDEFVANLGQQVTMDVTAEGILKDMDTSQEVKDLCNKYIDQAEELLNGSTKKKALPADVDFM